MSKELAPEKNVRNALHYLLNSLVNLYNEYGAGGAWGGCPIPLHELSKRLDITENIILNGMNETIELVSDPTGDFKKYQVALELEYSSFIKELDEEREKYNELRKKYDELLEGKNDQ